MNRPRRLAGTAALAAYRLGQKVRSHAFTVACSGAFESMGPRSVIQPPVRLEGEGTISIGSDVFVGQGSWFNVVDGPAGPGRIEVGDECSLAGLCVLSSAVSVRLGRSVLLARSVYVADHRHAFSDLARPVLAQGVEQVAPVDIGDGAWLGQNVVVGPGVSIGRGAVIGANSVVLGDVPAFAVAVGAPARVVRKLDETQRSTHASVSD